MPGVAPIFMTRVLFLIVIQMMIIISTITMRNSSTATDIAARLIGEARKESGGESVGVLVTESRDADRTAVEVEEVYSDWVGIGRNDVGEEVG